ncbi:MAG: hypothetical protein LBL20_04955, partial [Treponema sp.]|nr:hypothetical protein [Treponema sp.]
MKRALLILLILFAAGGAAFSEDGFSWEGNARMGSRIDFSDEKTTDGPRIQPFGDRRGEFALVYARSGLTLKTFLTGTYYGNGYKDKGNGGVAMSAETNYFHPDRLFAFCLNSKIISADGEISPSWFGNGPSKLWMYYNLFSGDLRLFLGIHGREDDDFDDGFNGDWNVSDLVKDEKFDFNPIDNNIPVIQFNYTGIENLTVGAAFSGEGALAGYYTAPDTHQVVDKSRYDFTRGFLLRHSVFGAKYAFKSLGDGGLSLAAMMGINTPWVDSLRQYSDSEYHAYLGFSYYFPGSKVRIHGDIKAVDMAKDQMIFAGLGTVLDFGRFYTELKVRAKDITGHVSRSLGFEALPVYTIIPNTMQLRVPAYVTLDFTGQELTGSFAPAVYWNLRGDWIDDDP